MALKILERIDCTECLSLPVMAFTMDFAICCSRDDMLQVFDLFPGGEDLNMED